jgi:tetratricopeptide (TPR) repeat protein
MKRKHFIGILFSMVLACGSLAWAETAQELHAKGEEAYRAKQYKKAVEFYSEALKMEPERHETIYCRGINYYKLAEWDQALADFVKLTGIKGIDHHAWNQIGLIHSGKWELNEAKGKLKEAREDLKETMDAFKKAFELQPSNVEYCLQIARTAVNMKTWHTAETFYGRALKLDSDNREAAKGIRRSRQAAQDTLKYNHSLGFPPSIPNDSQSLIGLLKHCEKNNIGADKAMEYLWSQGIDYWKKVPGAGSRLTMVLYKLPDKPDLVLALAFDDKYKIRRLAAGPLAGRRLK